MDKGCIRQYTEACTKFILCDMGHREGQSWRAGLSTNRRGRPVEIRSFVTANVIVRAVNREYLEAFQSLATSANWEILRSSRSYFLLSKVVLAQKKEQDCPK